MEDHSCECDKIDWKDKFKDDYIHDDSICKCCYSKLNRNEITYKEFKKICKMCKVKKHIYPPCTW